MPVPDTNGLPPFADFEDIKRKVTEIVNKYNNLLVNLDSQNVVSLGAGTIIVYDLAGGPGTITLTKDGMTVNNGTFDTFKVDINGNVTMVSAVIKSQNAYPQIAFNLNSNLMQAFSDANNHVDMTTSAGTAPGFAWYVAGALNAYLNSTVGGPLLASFSGAQMTLQASSHLNLDSSGDVKLGPSGSLRINNAAGQTGTVYVSATSGGVANIPITFTKGIRTT